MNHIGIIFINLSWQLYRLFKFFTPSPVFNPTYYPFFTVFLIIIVERHSTPIR